MHYCSTKWETYLVGLKSFCENRKRFTLPQRCGHRVVQMYAQERSLSEYDDQPSGVLRVAGVWQRWPPGSASVLKAHSLSVGCARLLPPRTQDSKRHKASERSFANADFSDWWLSGEAVSSESSKEGNQGVRAVRSDHEPGTQMYLAWQEKNDPTRFLHLFIFADEASQARHGQSDAVRRFESVYSPELVGGEVVFTDYELISGKPTPEQWAQWQTLFKSSAAVRK